MKVFITGGSGFIGGHLVSFLLEKKNVNVYVLARNRNKIKKLDIPGAHLLEGDLFAVPSLPRDLDCIVHIAGITKASKAAEYYTVNQKGTASLLRSIRAQRIELKRFIYLSSLAASGPNNNHRPILESNIPSPVSHYGQSKMMAEEEVLKNKDFFQVIILRAAAIYGPGDPGLIPYLKIVKTGFLPSPGFLPRPVSVCFIRDLIRAIDLAMIKPLPSGEIYNIADSIPRVWNELGRAAGKLMGVKLREIRVPLFLVHILSFLSEAVGKMRHDPQIFCRDKYREIKQKGWVADISKAREQLGFLAQTPFEVALKETLDWYRENRWI